MAVVHGGDEDEETETGGDAEDSRGGGGVGIMPDCDLGKVAGSGAVKKIPAAWRCGRACRSP